MRLLGVIAALAQKTRKDMLTIKARKSNWPEKLSTASIEAILRRAQSGHADFLLTPSMRQEIMMKRKTQKIGDVDETK